MVTQILARRMPFETFIPFQQNNNVRFSVGLIMVDNGLITRSVNQNMNTFTIHMYMYLQWQQMCYELERGKHVRHVLICEKIFVR